MNWKKPNLITMTTQLNRQSDYFMQGNHGSGSHVNEDIEKHRESGHLYTILFIYDLFFNSYFQIIERRTIWKFQYKRHLLTGKNDHYQTYSLPREILGIIWDQLLRAPLKPIEHHIIRVLRGLRDALIGPPLCSDVSLTDSRGKLFQFGRTS